MEITRKTGNYYFIQKDSVEPFKAFVPKPLPPEPSLELYDLYPLIEQATQAIEKLNLVTANIPNHQLFIYMYIRKEALLSSQIEGTQSSFADLLNFENNQKPSVGPDDVEEVSNYVAAITHGLKRLKEGFPLSLRLLKEIHAILLRGGRGARKTP